MNREEDRRVSIYRKKEMKMGLKENSKIKIKSNGKVLKLMKLGIEDV